MLPQSDPGRVSERFGKSALTQAPSLELLDLRGFGVEECKVDRWPLAPDRRLRREQLGGASDRPWLFAGIVAIACQPAIMGAAREVERLLARGAAELGGNLAVFDPRDFWGWPDVPDPLAGDGLPLGRRNRKFVKPLRDAPDQWLVATGVRPHYLLAEPRVECRFHAWSECRTGRQAIGMASINSRATESPRAFFVDEQIYHCAHQDIQDRREGRCHIAPIDLRTCCSACGFQDVCWDAGDLARLPCGR